MDLHRIPQWICIGPWSLIHHDFSYHARWLLLVLLKFNFLSWSDAHENFGVEWIVRFIVRSICNQFCSCWCVIWQKCHITSIYLVYTNRIFHVNSIYQVYIRYKTWINLSYDDIQYIPGIHLLKTFWEISVPVTLRYGHGINQVYTWFILGIFYGHTVTWQIPKFPRKFWVGVCQVYTVCRHMKGLYMFYTRNIPGIYYLSMVYIRCMLGIYSIFIYQV